ncbi:MAG: hypothetical protein EXR64_01245 [Dehalococcoidia bacterium]|nr:hypothetical protein [Dehalococcoidia bacterium]
MTPIRSGMRPRGALPAAALLALAVLVGTPAVALAHERRDVSGYQFVVGWIVEPALESQKNGVDLRITKDGRPVEGAEQTLRLEVTHVESNTTKAFTLRTIFNSPGAYTADLLPTATGVYKFRFTGTLDAVNVDQTFTASPNTFALIEPATAIQFPQAVASTREIQGAARGAADAAASASAAAKSASDAASTARMLALAGLALGAAGAGLGLLALRRR